MKSVYAVSTDYFYWNGTVSVTAPVPINKTVRMYAICVGDFLSWTGGGNLDRENEAALQNQILQSHAYTTENAKQKNEINNACLETDEPIDRLLYV
jgi:hypothetical protein